MNQDLLGSSITRNAVVLLDAAVKANGLKLTATGNLVGPVIEFRGHSLNRWRRPQ